MLRFANLRTGMEEMLRRFVKKVIFLSPLLAFSSAAKASIAVWSFTAVVTGFSTSAPISLPFAVSVGSEVRGFVSLDYDDVGAQFVAPFIRKYVNQPNDNIVAAIDGIPILEASTASFRHEAEVWNDSGFHDGADLFFMARQSTADARYSFYEVSMSISGNDASGGTVSSLALPRSLAASDFGGLGFGLGIIDTSDLSPSFQLSARVTSLTPVPEPGSGLLVTSGLAVLILTLRRARVRAR